MGIFAGANGNLIIVFDANGNENIGSVGNRNGKFLRELERIKDPLCRRLLYTTCWYAGMRVQLSRGPVRVPRDQTLHPTHQIVVRIRLRMETFRGDWSSAGRVSRPVYRWRNTTSTTL